MAGLLGAALLVGLVVVLVWSRRSQKAAAPGPDAEPLGARSGEPIPCREAGRGAAVLPGAESQGTGPVGTRTAEAMSAAGYPGGLAGELVAVRGPLAEQRFPISEEGGLAIGRHPDNDVVLAEEFMVSRYHAVVMVEDGQAVVYDRDSANGTWVNDQRVFRRVLAAGDRLQIWQSEFEYAGPQAQPAAAARAAVTLSEPLGGGVGEVFDGYVLEQLIGRGGMSEVYRARDGEGRTVAVKILCECDPYVVTKFVQEGNAIGPLLREHPGIVRVHRFAKSADGRLYIVMEYVDAPSLRSLLGRGLDEAEAVRIAGQMCEALGYAHERQIVHRDVKPENVLVRPDGVKVLDFGVAKLMSASTVTRNKIVGTPEYLSPEQAHGEAVVPASDVYAVGIVLYEMLSGRVPFPRPAEPDAYRAALEVVRCHLQEEPPPLRSRMTGGPVAAEVERVVQRALRKDAAARYATAGDMGEALAACEKAARRQDKAAPQAPAQPAGRRASPASAKVAGRGRGTRAQDESVGAAGDAGPPQAPDGSPLGVSGKAGLLVVEGPRQGLRLPLTAAGLTVGRQDLGSTNLAISRRHVFVFFRDGGYWLEDRSRNGTWVDGERVYGQVRLRPGATIVIGENVLALEFAHD